MNIYLIHSMIMCGILLQVLGVGCYLYATAIEVTEIKTITTVVDNKTGEIIAIDYNLGGELFKQWRLVERPKVVK